MSLIYKITNILNGKMYIGKTEGSIEKRFKEHIKEKGRSKHRPLYRAMNKYGVENFKIELIEETNFSNEREVYWIKYFDTNNKKNGYNATIGGDGKTWLDYNAIIECYKKEQNLKTVAKIIKCCPGSVEKVLKQNNIKIKSSQDISKDKLGVKINQYDLNDNYIQTFKSYMDAGRWLIDNKYTNIKAKSISNEIRRNIDGERSNKGLAYGFKWKLHMEK